MFSRLVRHTPKQLVASIQPRPIAAFTSARSFHATSTTMVQFKAGDSIPNIDVFENSPGNKVNLSQELASGDGLIIGIPGAFSPNCTDSHVPAYIMHPDLKSQGKVFVVGVHDAFVMRGWGKSLDPDASSGIRFISDPAGNFTRALDVEFDSAALLGTNRSKRYAAKTKDGKFVKVEVEPDNTGISKSGADSFLS